MNYDTSDNPAEHDCAWFEEEVQRLRAEVEWLRAQLAAGGSCQCGDDDVCVIVQERNAARARIRDLEAALRETHDALERLDAIYASEHDPDPVLGTVLRPAWLADALRHARTLLTPTAPEGGGAGHNDDRRGCAERGAVDYRCQICAAPMDGEAADPCTTHDPEQYGDHCTMHCPGGWAMSARELDNWTREIDCDHCGEPCVDYRQRDGERWCIGCVSVEADARIAEYRALRDRAFADEAEVDAALGAAGVPLGENPPDGAVGTRLYSTAQRVVMLAHERDMARAEVEMLRGVGCEEQKEGEPQSGRCGACIKCAQAERDEARQLGAQHHLPGMSAELDAVRWERDTALTRAHRIEAAARDALTIHEDVACSCRGCQRIRTALAALDGEVGNG